MCPSWRSHSFRVRSNLVLTSAQCFLTCANQALSLIHIYIVYIGPAPNFMEGLKLELDMEGTLDPRDALKDAWDEEDSKAAELAEEDFTTSDATAEQ